METRRLTRSRTDRIVSGVAGGLASYLNVDPLYVRLGFVLLGFLQGVGLILYLVLWLLVPNEDSLTFDSRTQVRESVDEMRTAIENLIERLRNLFQQQNKGPLN